MRDRASVCFSGSDSTSAICVTGCWSIWVGGMGFSLDNIDNKACEPRITGKLSNRCPPLGKSTSADAPTTSS